MRKRNMKEKLLRDVKNLFVRCVLIIAIGVGTYDTTAAQITASAVEVESDGIFGGDRNNQGFNNEAYRHEIRIPSIPCPGLNLTLEEIEIEPSQVVDFKVDYHKQYLKQWCKKESIDMPFDMVWNLREQCIQNLSN